MTERQTKRTEKEDQTGAWVKGGSGEEVVA